MCYNRKINDTLISSLSDNLKMITEKMIKANDFILTGNVRFKQVKRTSFKGFAHHKSKGLSYVISLGVSSPKGVVFHELYTNQGKLREFPSFRSIEFFLEKIKLISEDIPSHGEINYSIEKGEDDD